MSYRVCDLVCALILFTSSLTNGDRSAEEHIPQVLEDLNQLFNQTDPIMIDDIDSVFNKINNVLALEEDDVVMPGKLLQLIKDLGAVVDLNGSLSVTTVKKNIALLIADTTPANPIIGIAVARKDYDNFAKDSVQILNSSVNPDMMFANVSEMVVLLPATIRQQSCRISFVIFRDGRSFHNGYQSYTVNGPVVSVNVKNCNDFGPNEDISIYVEVTVGNMDSVNHECGYWHLLEDGIGYWSEEACKLRVLRNPPQLDICRCELQTLAYFARVLTPEVTYTPTAIKTTLSAQEQIEQVLDDMQQLLKDKSAPILMNDVNRVIDQVNGILQLEQDDLEFPGALLGLIDELGTRTDLNGSYTEAVVRDNIALLISDTTPDNPILGMSLASRYTDTFTEDSFNFLSNINASLLTKNVSEAVVFLPLSVTRSSHRISFVIFRDARVFSYNHELYSVNSRVIGINIENFTPEEYEVFDVHIRPMIAETNQNERRVCAYWNALEDGTGFWSQEGCALYISHDPWILNTCRCDHVTHLVQAVIPYQAFEQHNDLLIRILAVSGSLLSIVAVIFIALTATLFKSWRNNFRNQIWLQLCVALFLLSLGYLNTIFSWYDDYSVSCMITGIGIYFSILASYCWMLTVAFKACAELFLSPDTNPGLWTMLLASVFSWGLPIVNIIILGKSTSHMEPFENMHSYSKFCKPSGTHLWFDFFTPSLITIIIMIASWLVFFFVIYKLDIAPSNRNEELTDRNRATLAYARIGLGLVLLAGLPPWIFGFFAYSTVGAFLYTCTGTTQGLILFFFIICGDPPTRKLWLNKLRLKRQCDTTSSTIPSDIRP